MSIIKKILFISLTIMLFQNISNQLVENSSFLFAADCVAKNNFNEKAISFIARSLSDFYHHPNPSKSRNDKIIL